MTKRKKSKAAIRNDFFALEAMARDAKLIEAEIAEIRNHPIWDQRGVEPPRRQFDLFDSDLKALLYRFGAADPMPKTRKQAFGALLGKLESVMGNQWSGPQSPTKWAKLSDVHPGTLARWKRDGKIRVQELTTKQWLIHRDDAPK